jgi:hypothetical protein
VVQPWTEDPKAAKAAKEPTSVLQPNVPGFVGMLNHMHLSSEAIAHEAKLLAAREPARGGQRAAFLRLQFAGEEGIKNLNAIKNLQAMGKRHAYVHHGSKSGMEALLPGVTITVLGPPTLEQSDEIRKERRVDQQEFWMFQSGGGVGAMKVGGRLFPRAPTESTTRPPLWARWFLPRARAMRAEGMQQIVRVLDDAMNNTSVILLFEIGGQSFLFPGDAQIENWQYTMSKAPLMSRLKNVTFYKVGHHGSRNATPKTLWYGFKARGSKNESGRLQTVVSTMADKYGKSEGSEVPRKTLMEALEKESTRFTTQDLKGKTLSEPFDFNF